MNARDDLARHMPPAPYEDPERQRLLEHGQALRRAAAGTDGPAARARGAQAVTPHFLQWFAAELERGTDPGHLAEAFNEVMGSALSGFLQNAPRRQPTLDGLLDYHLKAIGIIAAQRLAEGKP